MNSPQWTSDQLLRIERDTSEREAAVPGLTTGTAAGFVWANSLPAVTEYSVVYIHGFSASRRETWPLADIVAGKLGANLYYPRLTGHGSSGSALAAATASDWIQDVCDAVNIGKVIGKKVLVIGMSTGGTLTLHHALTYPSDGIALLVLLSPNFGLRNRFIPLLGSPALRPLHNFLKADLAGFKPFNPDHERYWTSRYPLSTLRNLMQVVALTTRIRRLTLQQPVMFIYSPADRLLNVGNLIRFYHRLTAPEKRLLPITGCDNSESHVIAGTICSPSTTNLTAEEIVSFCRPRVPIG